MSILLVRGEVVRPETTEGGLSRRDQRAKRQCAD